ncbi:MAG: SurA N-terminal domain-containing protein [Pseudomonadota bacterium]
MVRVCLFLLMFAALAMPGEAIAQTRIVAVVNGEPITSYDVGQRQKLLRLTGARGNVREAALNELINERIQTRAVKQARITVSDGDIDAAIADIAKRAKLSPAQLSSAFSQAGVSIGTLKERIGAQVGFNRLVRARFNQLAKVTEQDLVAALLKDEEREKTVEAARYDLHQLTVALPQNPSAQRRSRAMARANDVRGRFNSCTEGLAMAKQTRNVVVTQIGRRMDVEFPPPIREKLEATPVGKLTEPMQQSRGIVMLAVCDKTMVRSANAAMKALEPDITSERGAAFSKQYLRQLRRDAVIERRG